MLLSSDLREPIAFPLDSFPNLRGLLVRNPGEGVATSGSRTDFLDMPSEPLLRLGGGSR